MQTGGKLRPPQSHGIGEWTFTPDSHELRCDADVRRLEHRVARTLELLCRCRGEIVSHEDIVAEVWGGRSISANSVPVVIRDIRRALCDDARKPRYIETVSKRGYRLRADPSATILEDDRSGDDVAGRSRGLRAGYLASAIVALVVLTTAMVIGSRWSGGRTIRLIVADVENATGSARYQPLATATGEVIALNAQRLEGVRVLRSGKARPVGSDVALHTRLILWEGRPTAMISAENAAGVTVWTSMTSGKEARIPDEVSAAIDDFGKAVK